ncbi:MAG: hypothetical protein ACSHX0_09515 [Akkermansiaceae bacterium]
MNIPTSIVEWLQLALTLAGVFQLILVIASSIIPHCLEWVKPLSHLPLLMRQVFWTYAGYIVTMHLFFGVLTVWGKELLIDKSPHAAILCGLMMTWWLVRIFLQFFCFDRKGIPQTRFNLLAEGLLICLFLFLTVVYAVALYFNLR